MGWGDGDARGVLYVRVQTAHPELENQPEMALGLSGALCSICKTVNTPSPEGVENGLAYRLGARS